MLANGAAATGRKVTIFFTFWGLNAIKKERKPHVRKDFWGRMFGWMLPADSRKLGLSKMNMGGIGARMMRFLMKEKGIDSLETLRQQAIDNGVEFIACQMSMDVMGIKREELLDSVSVGGVATTWSAPNRPMSTCLFDCMEKITCICVMRELFQALSLLESRLLESHGISLNEAVVLCSVGTETVTASTIVSRTGMTPSHASKVIRMAEEKACLNVHRGQRTSARCILFLPARQRPVWPVFVSREWKFRRCLLLCFGNIRFEKGDKGYG